MADDNRPKPEDAPDGFWDEFAKWATSEGNKQSVMDAFFNRNNAPAPTPNEDDPPTPPKKKKGWFSTDD